MKNMLFNRLHFMILLSLTLAIPQLCLAQAEVEEEATVENQADETIASDQDAASYTEVKIMKVKGLTSQRPSEDAEWFDCKVGDILAVGTEIRTGPRSYVMVQVGQRQLFRIDRMTEAKVVNVEMDGGTVRTDIGVTHGRALFEVDRHGAEVEFDTKIHTPRSTLAVRGTRGAIADEGGFRVQTLSFAGNTRNAINMSDKETKKQVALGGESKWNTGAQNAGSTRVSETTRMPGSTFGQTQQDMKQAMASGGGGSTNLISQGYVPSVKPDDAKRTRMDFIKPESELNVNDFTHIFNNPRAAQEFRFSSADLARIRQQLDEVLRKLEAQGIDTSGINFNVTNNGIDFNIHIPDQNPNINIPNSINQYDD